ncbi:4-hydroxybenzoate octaprenyltransferase [Kingella negevensis]|uniref:4-hydroxybenzoate octaprenyltransferase n=1 Tax=Kingella negevensis TaxID=1522312 RepID=A0A238HFL2_9NEIS|nr:4-hydroxybenzoate octaprenyltransferase [Kingella negevensis]MDK4680106.1 4-hydroxybenzoate octaprenyltransferase [Kingella negevensis]MDK4682174.1 4-hydroxybenzoate octaprenyltransferase [Kingella negevensis]MDK4684416.1 4-hydroxybenzoate octaprenyltransferase [Kingella negevensis]MDK4690371.1 4-hydroxybenzoate octaprenyltransferase [Kingella negevensis]MDK4692281.1 4-hydroxybenzoate octaprenyltransferase [Kingella negevensis]
MFLNHILQPEKWRVYVQLMRADKPIGTFLLLYPTLWAVWIASEGQPEILTVLAFSAGTFLMRSAGCVANDWADRDFDGHVERTKNRPFARGAVSGKEAKALILVLCALATLCLLPFNFGTLLMAFPALFLAFTYPLMKRFFPIPQLYLGLAFSFGIPMAFMAIQETVPVIAWWLFAANVFWTLAYDTIYAMADKEDDLKIGMKTSAITFGDWDAEMAMVSHGIFDLIMLQVGWLLDAAWVFWAAWCVVFFWQAQQYWRILSRDRAACFEMFLSNNKIGCLWLVAIAAHFAFV